MNPHLATLRMLLGAEAWRPEDLPEFDAGCQEFRQRRIKELEWELADLRRQLSAQDGVDALVENVLQVSFPELQTSESGGDPRD